MTEWFFEIFDRLPRQGVGNPESTLKALALVRPLVSASHVLDLGCGTGAQTRVLAQHSPARIVAIDNHPPFVVEANEQAALLGLSDRVDARVGDLRQLEFPARSFDLIWCEGAIYVIGFAEGLLAWRPLLVPGGHLAISEVCWSKPDPPAECAAFWAAEYPAIRDPETLLSIIDQCGYDTVDHFALPDAAWWDEYYAPLERSVISFRERHVSEPDAQTLADSVQREIDMWRTYRAFYHYRFFVMRDR
jgi:SAM-dependent methyltransferase